MFLLVTLVLFKYHNLLSKRLCYFLWHQHLNLIDLCSFTTTKAWSLNIHLFIFLIIKKSEGFIVVFNEGVNILTFWNGLLKPE